MKQATRKIVLDSCVVIDLIEKKGLAGMLRASLRGKPAIIVLCDVVLGEVQRVRGLATADVTSRIARLLGKKVEISSVDDDQRAAADSLTAQYQFCHRGDNLVLTLCRTRDFVLLTFDRMLLRACDLVGVAAFHPARVGGI